MTNPKIQKPEFPRRAFTLMELLIVITIIAILAGLALSGLASAVNQARAGRTRAQINKIDMLIMERYEGYRTKSVRVPANANAMWTARMRLYTLRELMRMELPDRKSDVTDNPIVMSVVPSLTQSYRRQALRATNNTIANWTTQHQGSECLYLILATMKDGDKSALEYFTPDEIGDVDQDGMKEILDGFGQPIEFLRWAPGYSQHPGLDTAWGVQGTDDDGNGTVDDIFEAGWPASDDILPLTLQTRIGIKHPTNGSIEFAADPFDPLRVDPRVSRIAFSPALSAIFPATNADTDVNNDTFALKPLIFSAGLDELYDVNTVGGLNYSMTTPPNDPYYDAGGYVQAGNVGDANGDGTESWTDNITNHFIEPQ